ncbi:hypothetical protein GAGA_4754 [Paraglaciecola agarilytica NO2]|uniref:Uncharacterized protein n=1 Tax=Paraglaciecola agarilytica NO2 TaxID=1125747 RepID=A0ABQ0IE71_9ALTE|nr:hypothetical protein GAGA_4754 [Paraglaciecola agarilytica NO2]
MERSDWLTTDGLSYPAWMLVSAAHALRARSACPVAQGHKYAQRML